MPASDVVEFRPHTGQDPELLQMQADTYGFRVQWPPRAARPPAAPVGTNAQAFGAAWCCFAVMLFVVRMMSKRSSALICFAAFACVCAVRADSGSLGDAFEGASYSLTWSVDNRDITLHYTGTGAVFNKPGGGTEGVNVFAHYKRYSDAAGTVQTGDTLFFQCLGAVTQTDTILISIPAGGSIRFVMTLNSASNPSGQIQNVLVLPEAQKYWVTFPISGDPADYFAVQNGKVVGQIRTGGPFLWRVGPLDSPDGVELHRITGGFVGDDGSGIPGIGPDTRSDTVGNPVTPALGYSGSGGSTGPSNPGPTPQVPANPTPDSPHPEGPPAPPAPPAPPHKDPPNGDPSGTGGATSGDVQKQTNDLVDALNGVATGENQNATAIVAAINSASASGVTNASAIVDALNGVKSATDKARAAIEAQDSTDLVPASGVAPADPASQMSTVDFSHDHSGSLIGALPVAPTFSGITASSTIHIAFSIPVPGHADIAVDKTVDFSQPPYSGPIAVFRACLLVLVTVAFYFGAFWAVRGAVAGK